jgi:hypothetical protein
MYMCVMLQRYSTHDAAPIYLSHPTIHKPKTAVEDVPREALLFKYITAPVASR